MPIKRLVRQSAAFPRIGKLRKGGEKPNERQPGKDLEYFRFDSDDADALQRFESAYGKEPRQVNVYLPYESVEENFQTWQEAYVAGGLKHRCDGETCVIWQKPDGTYSQDPIPCPGGCKEVGRLSVIIPELARLAYVTVETHSINDILQLTDNLQAALALRGSLTGIPFVLSRRPQEISAPGQNGKRQRYTKYMLFLEPHPDWVRVQLATMRYNALAFNPGGAVVALPDSRRLTDGRSVDLETGELVDDRADVEAFVGEVGDLDDGGESEPLVDQFSTGEPDYTTLVDKLTGNGKLLADWAKNLDLNGDGPASKAQYDYLAKTIDDIAKESHDRVLSVLCCRSISSDNPCSKNVAAKLLDVLLQRVPQKDAAGKNMKNEEGKVIYIDNPQYRPDVAGYIKEIASL